MKTIKIISFIAFLFISIVFFESCQKEQADTAVPEFTVLEPMLGDTEVGETHIEFTVTDNALRILLSSSEPIIIPFTT